jgi:hypothetical protein
MDKHTTHGWREVELLGASRCACAQATSSPAHIHLHLNSWRTRNKQINVTEITQSIPQLGQVGTSGVRFPTEENDFNLLHSVKTNCGTHPASYPMDTEGSLPWDKRPGRETDRSPPSSAYVKNSRATPPLPHMPSWHNAGVPAIMIEVYRYFPQFLQENSGVITQLGY